MFLIQTKIAYDIRVCYDFDLRSFKQVQGHWKEKWNNFFQSIISVSYGETLDVPTLLKDCLWSDKEKVHLCLIYTSLMKRHWTVLPHVKISYDLRVCHDFDPRSFVQVQGHWREKSNSCVRSIPFLWRDIGHSYFT